MLLESEMDGSPYGMEDDMDPEMMQDMGDMDDYDQEGEHYEGEEGEH